MISDCSNSCTSDHRKKEKKCSHESNSDDDNKSKTKAIKPSGDDDLDLSEKDRKSFLKEFWVKDLGSIEINEKRLETYIAKLLNLVSGCVQDKEREFVSVPLYTRMIAQVFQESFKRFYNSDQEDPQLPDKFDLLDLYKCFIEKKYETYYNEIMKTNIGNQFTEYTLQSFKTNVEKQHKYLALSTLFPKQTKVWFKDQKTQLSDQDLIRVGIINKICDDKPDFIHRTFAEYFAALWFADDDNLKEQEVKNFLCKEIFKEENKVIRNFFDRMLGDKSEIHIAVLSNDKVKIQDLLERNKGIINTYDKTKRTVLHLAAAYGYEEIVQFLLDKLEEVSELKISINVKCKLFNWSPVSYADKGSYWNIAELLLEKGSNSNDMFEAIRNAHTVDKRGKTLLHIAAEEGYVNFARVLIKEGADVNAKDKCDNTPLHLSAEYGKLDLVKFLIEKGAYIYAKDDEDNTPLHLGAEYGTLDIVKLLIEKGADINAKNSDDRTPLHLARESGKVDVVEYLVEKGADFKAKENNNTTPLHWAAYIGKSDIVEYQVGKGTNVNVKDNNGSTPLHWAAESGKLDVVKLLIEKGADFNVKNKYGSTPLHLAAQNGKSDVVKLLIEKGANVAAKDEYEKTPLHCAAEDATLDVVKFLIEKGADINAKNIWHYSVTLGC